MIDIVINEDGVPQLVLTKHEEDAKQWPPEDYALVALAVQGINAAMESEYLVVVTVRPSQE